MLKRVCKATFSVGMMALFSASAVNATTITTCHNGNLSGCFVSAEGLDRTEAIAKINFDYNSSEVLEVNESFSAVDITDFDLNIFNNTTDES